jgi:hypothetical protein
VLVLLCAITLMCCTDIAVLTVLVLLLCRAVCCYSLLCAVIAVAVAVLCCTVMDYCVPLLLDSCYMVFGLWDL